MAALGSRRTDKDGMEFLDTVSGPGGAGLFLCSVEEIGLELGSLLLRQVG